MNQKILALKQLDNQTNWLNNHPIPQPPEGWVRTIRKTLGMTISQLSKKLGVNPSRVIKIETAEVSGKTTINTLKKTAQALNCQFVYAFVPNSPLEELIRKKAKQLAQKQVEHVAHTMNLELQSVDQQWLTQQAEEAAYELLKHSWKKLWEE